jgi:hypothetical protein
MARSLLLASLIFAACSDDTVSCKNPGGAVQGPTDSHCGSTVQAVNQAACAIPDAGAPADGGNLGNNFGATLRNVSGDDDDCKYHVSWTASTICANANVFFTVTASNKMTGGPLVGANPSAEVFLNDTHPAPNSGQATTELGQGQYKIGPIHFDLAGQWTVRFHFFETCHDAPDSPHGHVAFFVNVP